MIIQKLIVWLIVGAVAGQLAGMVVTLKKEGLGRWINLLVGIAGALVGGLIFHVFKIDIGLSQMTFSLQDVVAAFLGSLALIAIYAIYRMVNQRRRDTPAG